MTTARGTICLFSGYTQKAYDPTIGMTALWNQLFRWREQRASDLLIFKREWNDNTDNIAAQIIDHRKHCKSERYPITIASFSWGQVAARKLADELRKRAGLRVDLWCAIDPVYRSRMILLRWLAFTSGRKIPVPRNVKHIESWIQTNRAPRGAHLIAHEDTYNFGEHDLSKVKGMDHASIQSHTAIHERIMAQFTELASGRMLR